MHQGNQAQGAVAGSRLAQVEQPVLVSQVAQVMKQLEELKTLTCSLEGSADRVRMEPQDAAAGTAPPQPEGGSMENRLGRIQQELNGVLTRLQHVAHRFDKAV